MKEDKKEVSGIVTGVENYGLFLELNNGGKGFLPKENMYVSKNKKIKDIFSEGFIIKAKIKSKKKDYLILSQKDIRIEDINNKESKKNNSNSSKTNGKSKKIEKKDNKEKTHKIKNIKKNKVIKKDISKKIKEEKFEIIETQSPTLKDLKKLKNIGNIKISVKSNKKLKIKEDVETESEEKKLPPLPKNFYNNFIEEVTTTFEKFSNVVKKMKEQGYSDES